MPPRYRILALALLSLPTALVAQASAHLGVRGVLHREAVLGNPVGGALQLDFGARERLDVRFTLARAGGTRETFEPCGDINLNCLPRAISASTQLTSVGVALPVRVLQRTRLSAHVVPELDGLSTDGTIHVGAGLGLELRYRGSVTSPIELLGGISRSRLAELGATADAARADQLTRLSVGVRYRFYTRR